MGEGSASSAAVQSPQGPGVFRRFLELMFMLASAIMVLFMWDTTTRARSMKSENEELKAELQKLKIERNTGGVFTFVCLLLSSVVLLFLWDRASRAQDENEALRGELRRAKARGEQGDSTACTVCLENPREVVLTACGHVCLCTTCADRIRYRDNRCPVCRKDIDKIKPVYIS